jgi:capsular polysaccharide biosynthesis protein
MHDSSDSPQDVTLDELLWDLWGSKWMVMVVCLAIALIAGLVAKVLPKQYQASIVVSPITEDAGGKLGGLSSVLSEVGGLSALGGLSLGGSTQKGEYVAVLQSEALTEEYIRSKGLLQVMYSKLWDPATGKWNVSNVRKQPTLWKANQVFKKRIRTVLVDNRTGLVTMTIKWTDPIAAAAWANDLVRLTNSYLRTKAIAESERHIAYLSEQALKTEVIGVKQAIYSIMESEINKAMIARGREEYALRVIDPAFPPEMASSPIATLWAVVGMVGGLMVCAVVAYVRLARKRGSRPAPPKADA